MRTTTTVLAAALLAPLAMGEGYGEELTTDQKKEIAHFLDLALVRELPSMDYECKAAACEDGCTEECQAATTKWKKKVAANPVAYYGEMFAKKPEAWIVLSPMIEKRFGDATGDQREIMLDLVAYAPYETSADLSSALWEQDRWAFSENHVLAFATRGGECFTEELRARVSSGKCSDVRPAALLAFYGDATGEKALIHAVKKSNYREDASQALVAAMALERLGKEGVFEKVQRRTAEEALAALDDGDLNAARQLALQSQFFAKIAEKGAYGKKGKKGKWAKIELAWLDEKIASHCEAGAEELASADEVFVLIESVTPM